VVAVALFGLILNGRFLHGVLRLLSAVDAEQGVVADFFSAMCTEHDEPLPHAMFRLHLSTEKPLLQGKAVDNGSDRQRDLTLLALRKKKLVFFSFAFPMNTSSSEMFPIALKVSLPYPCTPTKTFDAILPPFSTASVIV